ANVVLSVEKTRHTVEVSVPIGRFLLRAEASTPDMYASFDAVTMKLERQYRKYKARIHRYAQVGPLKTADLPAEEIAEDAARIVRRKTFSAKPMPLEEALAQMDLLGHSFFAFINADTGSMNVLYHRQDGEYGLLEAQ
ncbi:MAG: ribosome-associated translation inhibitor RaiA, partial [Firmicutes bacterium]|nr:ribosome-associated translation inhibitor RaiA [Bacillota bacterium]